MVVWEKLIEVLPDAVLAFGSSGDVCFANRAAASLLGFTRDELVGMPVARLLPERSRIVDGLPFHLRWANRAADGHITAPVLFSRGAEIEVDWTLAATENLDGKPLVVAMLRRRPEALDRPGAREDSASRILRLVFEHAPIGVFHFDDRAIITACNDRFVDILGSSRQRLVGLHLSKLPDEGIRRCVEETLAGRPSRYDGDYKAVTGDRVTPVRVEFAPIVAEGGRVMGGVGLAEDVSERKDAERRAATAERMASLGTLAAGVVHELQNPLAFVITNLDLALRLLAAGEVKTAVENAREGSWRVATIVRDLKAFARSDEDRRRPVDVHDAVEAAIKLSANQLRHRATLRRDLRAQRRVRASEPRLVQLFVNLLLNAAEALPEGNAIGEWVTVATRDVGDDVVISVEDTGRGVPPELLDRLFEPFVTDKPGGMGLGLAICHGIVASLGGSITASAALPRGTRFEVRLPALAEAEVHPAAPAGARPKTPVTTGRVLIVDDEERLAETIKMALSPPHQVDVCTRSREVLGWLEDGRDYDVVLCDLMMPDLSGPDLYDKVKASRPELASRFVFLTGGAFTPRTRDFLHQVPNPRLEKPFDLEALEQIVKDTMSARGAG